MVQATVTESSRERVGLRGVPETLLWPLYNRAHFASLPGALLQDPRAVELRASIDYPFAEHFGRPNEAHALRALRFDDEIRRFLRTHPEGTVVALGEGLQTTFHRVDNGSVRWLAVDLPETVAIRNRLLPDSARHRSLACSALDLRWIDEVDREKGVFVTAEGLLMYFEPPEVRRLVSACAERFPGGEMMFDVIPRWLSKKTQSPRGWRMTKRYRTPPMPWGIDVGEIAGLRDFHGNIVEAREIDMGKGKSFLFGKLIPFVDRLPLPKAIADKRPAFVLVRFGPG